MDNVKTFIGAIRGRDRSRVDGVEACRRNLGEAGYATSFHLSALSSLPRTYTIMLCYWSSDVLSYNRK